MCFLDTDQGDSSINNRCKTFPHKAEKSFEFEKSFGRITCFGGAAQPGGQDSLMGGEKKSEGS